MKKKTILLPVKNAWLLLAGVSFLALQSCDNPYTIAMHSPIYPSTSENVTYSLEMLSGTAPKEVKLFERVDIMNVIRIPIWGTVIEVPITTPGAEALLQTWTNPALGTLSHVKASPNPANSVVTYRFEIKQSNNSIAKHQVTYATRDYPLTNAPAPVYVVGSQDNTFDVVFIPDTDITNMGTFRNHCRAMIRDAFFDENTTKLFRHSFNFYINPLTGHATDFDRIATDGPHQVPANNAMLSFAEGRVLMHQNNLRDYASGGLYSTEMQNRGTVMHESGHGLFGLADEYSGGAHWQDPVLPNNWNSLAGAQADAPGRSKTAADAVQIGTESWWKLCVSNCQMLTTGATHTSYDSPCSGRVVNRVVEKAQGN